MAVRLPRVLFLAVLVAELLHLLVAAGQHRVPLGHDGLQYFTLQYYFLNNARQAREVAQWVPYIVHDLNLRFPKLEGKQARPDVLSGSKQLFVACQTDDDLPYVLKYAGENCLMIGSDYGHADTTAELRALSSLRETTEVDGKVVDKILDDNARALYGLN